MKLYGKSVHIGPTDVRVDLNIRSGTEPEKGSVYRDSILEWANACNVNAPLRYLDLVRVFARVFRRDSQSR
jgi:hypothetical protein